MKFRRRMAGTAFAGLAAIALLWGFHKARVQTLLDRARVYALPAGYSDYRWRYGWLAADRALLFGSDERGRTGTYRFSLRDGQASPVPALTALLSARMQGGNMVDGEMISPDGRWLLLFVAKPRFGQWEWLVTRTDGSKHTVIPFMVRTTRGGPFGFWLSDSKRWVEWYYTTTSRPNRIGTLLTEYDTSGMRLAQRAGAESADGVGLFALPNGAICSLGLETSRGGGLRTACVLDPRTPAKPVRAWSLRVPNGWYAQGSSLSPAGDRIVWQLLEQAVVETDSTWFGRIKEKLGRGPRIRTHIVTTRLDGTEPRDLGMVESSPTELGLTHAQWTPDAHSISFLFDGKLYVVAAD